MANAASPAATPRTAVAPRDQNHEPDTGQQSQTAGTQQEPSISIWKATLDDPIALYTLILAVATTFLWLFTAGLWYVTFRLSKDAKASGAIQADKMECAIAEAARAADEAIAANRIAEKTAEHHLRAYVGIEDDGIEPYEWGSADAGKAIIRIQNYGQTPATQCVTKISLAVAPYDREAPVVPTTWDRESLRSPRDIPPGGSVARETALPADAIVERLEEIEAGSYALYIRVEITYSSFKKRYRQTTVLHAHGKRYREGKLNTTKQCAEELIAEGEED